MDLSKVTMQTVDMSNAEVKVTVIPTPASDGYVPSGRESLVRSNLMSRRGYSPYCGSDKRCCFGWPRSVFDGEQFSCRCGWMSSFEPEFIAEYKAKWGK